MDFNLLKLALLLFPGVIVTSILQFFNIKSQMYSTVKFCLYSFIYGTMIELFYFSLFVKQEIILKISSEKNKVLGLKVEELELSISYQDILFLLIISILVGLILSFLRNSGYIHKIFNKYHVTYETGFETLLYAIYHSKDDDFLTAATYYVHIKLLNGKASYYGILRAYEEQKEYIEIFLKEPEIYFENNTPKLSNENKYNPTVSKKIYEKDFIYLQLKPCEFYIEYIKPKTSTQPKTSGLVKRIPVDKYYLEKGIYQCIIIVLIAITSIMSFICYIK